MRGPPLFPLCTEALDMYRMGLPFVSTTLLSTPRDHIAWIPIFIQVEVQVRLFGTKIGYPTTNTSSPYILT